MPARRAVVVSAREDEVLATWRAALQEAGFEVELSVEPTAKSASVWVLRAADDESALALLTRLRSQHDAPIVIAAQDPAGLSSRALRAGAQDVLGADATPEELVSRVEARLSARDEVDALSVAKRDAGGMLELTQALASSLDFHEILYTVVRRIADVVQVSRVSIVLAPEPGTIVMNAAMGICLVLRGDRRADLGAFDRRGADDDLLAAEHQDVGEVDGAAHVAGELFDANSVAFVDPVLLPAGSDDCVHDEAFWLWAA